MKTGFLAAACAALLGTAAHAGTVFNDNFDANTPGLNKIPAGWTVSNGSVDVIGSGYYDFYPGNGAYIDLDGSTAKAGVLSRQFNLLGGVDYLATLTLGGSTRGDRNDVLLGFGSAAGMTSVASNAALAPFSVSFTPASSGWYTLSIANSGGDNLGAILTNVNISAVPEPSSPVLVLAGLAVLAGVGRRRRSAR